MTHVPGISVRQLARVSGNLIALELSFGDIVHLRSKAMQMMIASGSHWDAVVPWSAGALEEVQFWKDHLEGLNGMSLEPAIAAGVVSYSDASSVAAAAIISPGPCKETIVVHHTFTEEERRRSSTFRELLVVVKGLEATRTLFIGNSIQWKTDCGNIVHIVKRGSMRPHLMELALRVYHATRDYQIGLNVVWIPRALNEQADYFSRVTDCDDWGVQTAVVRRMESWWGPFDVHRFANAENTHCARFNSRF